jgi:hypothetical protein
MFGIIFVIVAALPGKAAQTAYILTILNTV